MDYVKFCCRGLFVLRCCGFAGLCDFALTFVLVFYCVRLLFWLFAVLGVTRGVYLWSAVVLCFAGVF